LLKLRLGRLPNMQVEDWVLCDSLAPEISALTVQQNIDNAKTSGALAIELRLPEPIIRERLLELWKRRAIVRLRGPFTDRWLRYKGYRLQKSKLGRLTVPFPPYLN